MVNTYEPRDLRLERRTIFIEKAVAIYGESYDYSSIDFIDSKTPISLYCQLHGEFTVPPAKHLNGQHCRRCKQLANAEVNRQNRTNTFIRKAQEVHGERFDYSRANEMDTSSRCIIICRIHGPFRQFRGNHLEGRGCRKCSNEDQTTTLEEFIERAERAHGVGSFDYSKVQQFKTTRDKVLIICPIHGDFLQIARDHMRGVGCSSCRIFISQPEMEIFEAISSAIPERVEQSVRSVISPYELDIYIPDLKLAIEFNGVYWHPKRIWMDDVLNGHSLSRESLKSQLCSELNIRLIHIWEDDYRRDSEWWLNAILEAIARARIEDIAGLDSHIHSLELRASEQIPETTGQLSSWSYSV